MRRGWTPGLPEAGSTGGGPPAAARAIGGHSWHLAGDEEADVRDRWNLLYGKGPLVIHGLRQELGRRLGPEKGDPAFFTLLRSFMTNFAGKRGETRHLVGLLNQMTGSDWQPWFERYVYGTEMPPVEL